MNAASSVPKAELSEVAWGRVSDDPLDLASLGREIGAKRCVDEIVSGGVHGGEALQVLPFTPDAESQLGPLCDSLDGASPGQRSARLAGLSAVLARGAKDVEVAQAGGLKRCASILKKASQGAEGRDRDYIESALAQLASRHVSVP